MRIPVNDLQRQALSMEGELNAAVSRVIRSGRYIGGPELDAFEQAFARACGPMVCARSNRSACAVRTGDQVCAEIYHTQIFKLRGAEAHMG